MFQVIATVALKSMKQPVVHLKLTRLIVMDVGCSMDSELSWRFLNEAEAVLDWFRPAAWPWAAGI
jgi:hypothetical protein